MKKTFEYKRVCVRYCQSPVDELNKLGSEGWEMCGVESDGDDRHPKYFYFKRETTFNS